MSYEERRNPHLPWGYWLLATTVSGRPTLEDEEGRCWASVREAFWGGRLGMDVENRRLMNQQLELMLGVLAAHDRRIVVSVESVEDMFQGSHLFLVTYISWLKSEGLLTQKSKPGSLSPALTPEGQAVLIMLASTRIPGAAAIPVGPDAVRSLSGEPSRHDERERWFKEVDTFAAKQRFFFQRTEVAGRSGIVLIGERMGRRIPIRRVLWSQSFADEESRDAFYLWLCMRLDRWEAWGEAAFMRGAARLTQHLVSLMAAEMVDKIGVHPRLEALDAGRGDDLPGR